MISKFAPLFSAVLLPMVTGSLRAADEAALIATVESSASAGERADACRLLLAAGSARCIPALAAALDEEGVSHAALNTLERLPQPEAAAALREALATIVGPLKASVADTLGWRQDSLSVPLLSPLLRDSDEALASTSALALGRIGNVAAEEALATAMSQAAAGMRPAIMEGYLLCAEARLQAGEAAAAIVLYDKILAADPPKSMKAAAGRGLLVADEPRRPERLARWMSGNNELDRRVALQFLPNLRDGSAVLPLLDQWKSLPTETRIALLENHPLLGAEAPGLAITAAQDNDAAVRLAAFRGMGGMSSPALVPVLAKAAVTSPKAEQLCAQNSLAALSGPGIEQAILSRLEQARDTEQDLLLRTLGQRGDEKSAGVLLHHARAEEPSTRQAARQGLLLLASSSTLQPVIELALATDADSERTALVRIAAAICQNPSAATAGDSKFTAAIDSLASPLAQPEQAITAAEMELAIAEAMLEQRPQLAAHAAQLVIDRSPRPEMVERARALQRATAEQPKSR